MFDTLPCGHDPKWRIGNPDDPGSTQGCELCNEIGKERERCAKIVEGYMEENILVPGVSSEAKTRTLSRVLRAIRMEYGPVVLGGGDGPMRDIRRGETNG